VADQKEEKMTSVAYSAPALNGSDLLFLGISKLLTHLNVLHMFLKQHVACLFIKLLLLP
jgi:hypothetical protein